MTWELTWRIWCEWSGTLMPVLLLGGVTLYALLRIETARATRYCEMAVKEMRRVHAAEKELERLREIEKRLKPRDDAQDVDPKELPRW